LGTLLLIYTVLKNYKKNTFWSRGLGEILKKGGHLF
jgi:hypothetical protein